jgi:hypothetical protein
MGQVFERQVHLGFLSAPKPRGPADQSLRKRVGAALDRLLGCWPRSQEAFVLPDFKPDIAALILPVDQSGRFLQQVPLTVCPRELAIAVINECSRACGDLQAYIDSLLREHADKQRCVLLTENWAEGGFIDFERETELYCHLVERSCGSDSTLFVKPHPAESLPRVAAIRARLGRSFKVVELDPAYRRYPIEVWPRIVRECRILSVMYPVLSLKFLYDVDVIQPMDDAMIEEWFPAWTQASYKNSLSLNMEPLARLSRWDGRSVLWSPVLADSAGELD